MIRFKYFVFLNFFLLFSCAKEKKQQLSINKQLLKKDLVEEKKPAITKIEDILFVNKTYVLGKFQYRKNPLFAKVATKYSSKEIYIRTIVYKAFIAMASEGKKEDVTLQIISGTRNFYEQKAIWERKWKKHNTLQPFQRAKKILEFSSMPTTSRHHWGTDIDLNNLNNVYFEKGKGKKEYDWLVKNANNFGFYQVYTSKENGRTGYNEEKWHWSYMPLAKQYLDFYINHVSYKDITGFEGSKLAQDLEIIPNYVNGINKKALDYQDVK